MGDLQELSVVELLRLGSRDAHRELRTRGVLRSNAANPTGDYAEWLVAEQLGVSRMPQSQLGYDLAPLEDGTRVQVKGRRVGEAAHPQVFGTIYELAAREFDALAAVLLNGDWTVRAAWWIPWDAVSRIARYSERRHHWRIPVRGSWQQDPAVETLDLSSVETAAGLRSASAGPAPQASVPMVQTSATLPSEPPPATGESERIRELVCRYEEGDRGVGTELRRLGVLDGAPASPAGDFARFLVARSLAGVSSHDARTHVITGEGERLQVRGRHRKSYRDPTFFAVDFDPGERTFDGLVAVLFEIDYRVAGAWLVPWQELERLAVRYKGTGHRLRVAGNWRGDPAVRDLSASIGAC